ncbi:MAG: peptidylprolyl isomerase [candidate division WOR-3 bacterium]|mgnify:CR=1 FL=1|jgi:FKBP-type peptidyl-prolyl cis-trans isomerase SlyD
MDKITKDKVVEIEYSLYDENGQLIESSESFKYLHGHNNIIIGLEEELEGLSVGDEKEIVVPPEKAYGNYNFEAIQSIPMDVFEGFDIKEGETYYAESNEGEIIQFKVIKIDKLNNEVIVDFNHPLAGKTLKFNIKVKDIRDATEEELEHGHPH